MRHESFLINFDFVQIDGRIFCSVENMSESSGRCWYIFFVYEIAQHFLSESISEFIANCNRIQQTA